MTKIVPLANVTSTTDRVELASLRGGVISIGNFDGVHRGHAALLREVRAEADRIGGPAIAVALDPHPAAILRPELAPPKLTRVERRAELMSPIGIDALVVCQTGGGLLKLTADDFFEALVRQTLSAKVVVEGPNFFFGRGRGGDIETLKRLSRQSSIDVRIVEPESAAGGMISSTRIRGLIASGEIVGANAMLGTEYQISGRVVAGARRGRSIGFPTANIEAIQTIVPAIGVYGGWAHTAEDPTAVHPAAIHIGPNPTFDIDQSTKVEVHLMDYDGDLYEQELFVDFAFRVRDVSKFESVAELAKQLRRDVDAIEKQLPKR